MPRPDPPRWPRVCLPAEPARARASGCSTRTAPTSSSEAWQPPASAQSPCRSAPSPPRRSCTGSCAGPTSRSCSRRTSFRRRDYVASLREAVPGLDLDAEPLRIFIALVPALRQSRLLDGVDSMHTRRLRGRPRACGRCPFRRRVQSVSPADRLVIVHTSGSTSAPKGVIHQHGALLRHLDNLNEIRRLREPRDPLLQLAVLLDRRLRLRAARHAARRRHARVLQRHRPGPCSTCSSGPGRRWSTASRHRRASAEGPDLRRARPEFDPARQPVADHAD
jgi:hypothetical protein